MRMRFRWGSGLTGAILALVALWAVLSPSSLRRLASGLSTRMVAALFSDMRAAGIRRTSRVCAQSFVEDIPGVETVVSSQSPGDLRAEGAGRVDPVSGSDGAVQTDGADRHSSSGGAGGDAGGRPMVVLGPNPGLTQYLQAELSYLTILRQLGRELRRTVTGLWAARARRMRALDSWEVTMRRLRAQKERVERRRKDLSSFYRALYKMVDGWDDMALLDRRRRTPPLDGRMELLSVIAHLRKELAAENRVLASLDEDRRRARAAMDGAKAREAALDALRDSLRAKIARAQQELLDLRRCKEKRNRSGEVWDRRARRLHRALVELEQEVRRQAAGFESFRGKLLRPVPGAVLPYPASGRDKAVLVGAEPGWWARAPATGKVVFAGPVAGFGEVVILDHGDGFTSVLGYLSRLDVKVGERVRAGRPLGRVAGPKGLVTRKRRYCYYELRRSGVPLDPFEWLRSSGRRSKATRLRRRPHLPKSLPEAVAERLTPAGGK